MSWSSASTACRIRQNSSPASPTCTASITEPPSAGKERIDERTWLEKFHDWKHHLWFLVRRFFRSQFTVENRDRLRARQANLARRSRIVGVAQFAQIPLLNDHQLVARWRQELPPTYVSDSQELPIDPLPSGLYLIEATDGHYKAYTLLMVSRMAMVTRTGSGSVLAYCVDRVSGAGIAGVQVSAGFGQQQQASGNTDADGLAELHLTAPKRQQDNFWVLATSGNDVAAVTPGSYALSGCQGGRWSSYIYTDRPVYRPGHIVHWKAILRARVQNHLELPKLATIHVTIADQDDHALLDKDMPVSPAGSVYRRSDPAGDCDPRLLHHPLAQRAPFRRSGCRRGHRHVPRGGLPQSRSTRCASAPPNRACCRARPCR